MRPTRGDSPTWRWLSVAAITLLATGLLFLRWRPEAVRALAGPCVLHSLTGVACPTCGTTGALVELAHGHWLAALGRQPLAVAACLGIAAWGLVSLATALVPSWRRRLHVTAARPRHGWWWLVGLLAANWLWVALR